MVQRRTREVGPYLAAVLAAVVITGVGAVPGFVVGADTGWFDEPWFYPPEFVFPVVWTSLFILMGVAVSIVWRSGWHRRDVRLAMGAFVVQFALNLAWTPVFFGLQRPTLALIVLVALWGAIVATIIAFDRLSRRAALLLLPYLAWVTFAGVLNAAIVVVN